MNDQERHNLFAELVTTHQSQLYGYIFALVRNWEDAADLFQSVCVVLWKKFDSYEPGVSHFFPWARQTAVFEVRNFLRRKKSRQHLAEEMLEALTETPFDREDDATAGYLEALGRCKQKLPAADVELLDFHYSNDLSAQQIADRLGRSRQSVCNSLLRVRRWLMDCIRLGMAQQERSSGGPAMNAPATNLDRLLYLTNAVCANAADDDELGELDAILHTDKASHAPYLEFCRLHVALGLESRTQAAVQKTFAQIELGPTSEKSLSTSAPLSTLHSSLSTYFSSGWPMAYLIATVALAAGALISSFTYVSHYEDAARISVPKAAESQQESRPIVARITGMVECIWAGAAIDSRRVPLGHKYELASGLMEITYRTGSKVILQGPAIYEVDTRNGGHLLIGKLTGKVETAEAKGFSVRTPTAIVTDLGTEFGVEVDRQGSTTSHVFRGSVRVQRLSADGAGKDAGQVLHENQSARVMIGKDRKPTIQPAVLDASVYVRGLGSRVRIPLFNTGVDASEGGRDSHWQIAAISNIRPPIKPRSAWVTSVWMGFWGENDRNDSQWISTVGNGSDVVDGVTYTFRTAFDLAGFRPETARLQGEFMVDNHVRAIRLNGADLRVPSHGYDLYQVWHAFAASGGFVEGVNVLEVDVENGLPEPFSGQGSPMGLRVRLRGSAERKASEQRP